MLNGEKFPSAKVGISNEIGRKEPSTTPLNRPWHCWSMDLWQQPTAVRLNTNLSACRMMASLWQEVVRQGSILY